MKEYWVGAVVFGIAIVVAWWFQAPLLALAAVIAGVIGLTNQREWSYVVGDWDRPSSAPRPVAEAPHIDLDDELADLLISARQLAGRRLVDDRRFVGFVMYEAEDGDVKVRDIRVEHRGSAESHARDVARALDPTVRRVVTAVTTRIDFGRGVRPAVLFEAGQAWPRPRTTRFVQPYRPSRGPMRAVESGGLLYIGDGDHLLRFAAPSRAT